MYIYSVFLTRAVHPLSLKLILHFRPCKKSTPAPAHYRNTEGETDRASAHDFVKIMQIENFTSQDSGRHNLLLKCGGAVNFSPPTHRNWLKYLITRDTIPNQRGERTPRPCAVLLCIRHARRLIVSNFPRRRGTKIFRRLVARTRGAFVESKVHTRPPLGRR